LKSYESISTVSVVMLLLVARVSADHSLLRITRRVVNPKLRGFTESSSPSINRAIADPNKLFGSPTVLLVNANLNLTTIVFINLLILEESIAVLQLTFQLV
jgi:hypothetical protein